QRRPLVRGSVPAYEKLMTDTFDVAGASASAESAAFSEETTQQAQQPNAFAALGLASELVRATMDLGYTEPTAVQLRAIPLALPRSVNDAAGHHDLMVSSQTGSGKTAAFLLPVLHTLLNQQAEKE